jgi:hypothetical protein
MGLRDSIFLALLSVVLPLRFAAGLAIHNEPFELSAPTNWANVLPNENSFILQGPGVAGRARDVIFVSFTGIKHLQFNPAGMQARIDSYTEGRRKYITAKGGRVLRYIPYSEHKGLNGAEFHSAGVDYQIGRDTYHERSSYVSCGGTVFQVKTLDFADPDRQDSADAIGRTFKCAR